MTWNKDEKEDLLRRLVEKFGEDHRFRLRRGLDRVITLWCDDDGDRADLAAFCEDYFIADPERLERTFQRLAENFETLHGHLHVIRRELKTPLDLERGEPLPVDYLFAAWDPAAHVTEDLYQQRIAFVVALNFPYWPLAEKLARGADWDRRQWAEARLGDLFTVRVPAAPRQAIVRAEEAAAAYINRYDIPLGRLLDDTRHTLFPAGLTLIAHWGLRDEIRAQYGLAGGLVRQEIIHTVMGRIIDGSIPREVVTDKTVHWQPGANRLWRRRGSGWTATDATPEATRRYEYILDHFHAQWVLDAHYPLQPSLMDRQFELERQIPETEVERLLVAVLAAPVARDMAAWLRQRLGRPLRPFDIWYDRFGGIDEASEADLDERIRRRYPDPASFQRHLPHLLQRLGFAADTARFLSDHIVVDPARGAGHAWGAAMRSDAAHLRTRFGDAGMDAKGFRTAIHELGHCVEQVFSLNAMDHYLLQGVPNNAFTECFAFLFQNRHRELLDLAPPDSRAREYRTLDTFWNTFEIAGVALTDMRMWRWLYAHPDATPAGLQAAVRQIAGEIWNTHYQPLLGEKDSPLLAIYSHMVQYPAYLPNYPLGHIIMFQVEHYLADRDLALEMERMCRLGRLTPDQWMQEAVGAALSAEPLLAATAAALRRMQGQPAR